MKSRKILCMLLAIFLCFGLAACAASTDESGSGAVSHSDGTTSQSASSPSSDAHYPVTVNTFNYAGEEIAVTFEKAPERVVAVYQGCIETMIALGLEDHVVASFGLDNEVKDEWKAGFEQMHYHTAPFAPDKETVTLLEPDLIFSWGSLFGEKNLGDVDTWISQGTNTLINRNTRPGQTSTGSGRTLENEYQTILDVGTIFNVEEKAQALVDEMKLAVDQTLAAVEGAAPVSVAVVEPFEDGRMWNRSAKELVGDMVVSLGGEMALPDVSGDLDKEALLAADPDVIFVIYMAYDGDDPERILQQRMDAVVSDPSLSTLSAVKNGRVYPVMLGDVYAAGPRCIDGIRTLAQGMYPDLGSGNQ